MEELVKTLKPFVTTFSEAIPTHCKHGDEVRVGGQIVDVLDMSQIIEGDGEKGVYITLDDGVGHVNVVLPESAYHKYKEAFQLDKGMVVLVEGRVFVVDTTHTEKPEQKKGKLPRGKDGEVKVRTYNNHDKKTVRVFSWEVTPLPKTKEPETT